MNPNWFLALPVSPDGWFPDRIGPTPPQVRRFNRDDLHLTIAFLGGVGEAAAMSLWEEARLHPGPAGPGTLDHVVPMGRRSRPSALSVLLDEGNEAVCDFISAHRERWLAAVDARPDTRPPKPHCTVARPTRRASMRQVRAAVAWAATLDVRGVPVEIGPLALYTWAEDRREHLFRIVDQAR